LEIRSREANMGGDMRSVKCEAAAEVIGVLQRAGVDVLYLEGFALDEWRPWGTQLSDDLQVFIPHGQIDAFMAAMRGEGYLPALYDQQAGGCRDLDPEQAKRAVLKMPVSPEPFYVHPDWIREGGEPDLLVRFHTTKRHGRLLLADLQEWFRQPNECEVMGGTEHAVRVNRPPRWAMLLWQAGEVMNHASDCAITRGEVDKLHVVAAQQPDPDRHPDWEPLNWGQVLDKAREYSTDYNRRITCPAATELLEDYRGNLGIGDPALLQRAEGEYGALYELNHALKALIDDPERYRDAVPDDAWRRVQEAVEELALDRPRKLWGYPGGQENVPGPGVLGRLGLASEEFGIHQQIEEHAGADFGYLLRHRLVRPLISNAPPHGPWACCSGRRLNMIFDA
jgi:hypothetical protein